MAQPEANIATSSDEADQPVPAPATEVPAADPEPPKMGLRALALRGSMYEIIGFGAANVIRLAGNMVLTRLLFPEAFGLAALVHIFNQGLVMLSDLGIAPGVIQSPRGDEEEFLNTAYTMQVIRGIALAVIAAIVSWPIAVFYDSALLGQLMAVGSIGVAIGGFTSTSLLTLRRRVEVRPLVILELATQVIGLVFTVVGAYFYRSAWSLILGLIVSAVFRTIVSHYMNVGYRNRLFWSPAAAQAIVGFGRWIFFASAIHFVSQQADRVFMGRYVGVAELGIYGVAFALSEMGTTVVSRLTSEVFYPIFSRVHREDPGRLRSVYYKTRLATDALTLPAVGAVIVLAPFIIQLMYDDRYLDAGWMLQVLAFRVLLSVVLLPCETCLFAMGQSKAGLFKSIVRAVWMLIALPLGYHFYGIKGIVWATALSELPVLLVLFPVFAKFKMLSMIRELRALAMFLGGLGVTELIALAIR